MYPVNNYNGILEQEQLLEGDHVIVLLFVKPSDENAEHYIKNFNYLHYRSKNYCSIYLVGYSVDFNNRFDDIQNVAGINNNKLQYSDACFINVCNQLEDRLKNWRYSGEPEMIILQKSSSCGQVLDFSNYNYIDINYGLSKGYLDSFPRFIERFIRACKSEVTSSSAIRKANKTRLKLRTVLENTIELTPKLPLPVKRIFKDKLFFKSCNSKVA